MLLICGICLMDVHHYHHYLDISKWNTNIVTDMRYMFSGCSNTIFSKDIKSKFNKALAL